MTQSKVDFKSTVIFDKTRNEIDLLSNEHLESIQYLDFDLLCDNFGETFFDLLQNVKCNFESYKALIDKYLDIFRFADRLELRFVYTSSKLNLITFNFELSCGDCDFLYNITFDKKGVLFFVYDSSDYSIVDSIFCSLSKNIDSLFNIPVSQIEEENISEPEQPEEDAEEQSEMIDTNMGAMPIEDYREIRAIQYGFDSYEDFRKAGYYLNIDKPNISEPELPAEENKQGVELTPLERIVFEARVNCFNNWDEFSSLSCVSLIEDNFSDELKYNRLAFDENIKFRLLDEIILKVGLQEKYNSWLEECQNQEALTIL